jgi:hypothetical protein
MNLIWDSFSYACWYVCGPSSELFVFLIARMKQTVTRNAKAFIRKVQNSQLKMFLANMESNM